jgi:hypothetical protein
MRPLDRPENELVAREPDLVEAFYDLDLFQLAVAAQGWTLVEEMSLLQKIMRDPDPRVSIQGLRHFRTMMKEIATVSGRLAVAREKRIESDGREITVKEVESGVQLQKRLAHRAEDRRFPVSQRLPTDVCDSGAPEDHSDSMRPTGGPDAGPPEPDGHHDGGGGDDRDSDLEQAVGLG